MAKETPDSGGDGDGGRYPQRDGDGGRYPQRDLSQTLFFKVACRTFGPPKSRTRRIVAPPMPKLESDPEALTSESSTAPRTSAKPGGDPTTATPASADHQLNISDWISERKRLRTQLDSMGDVKKWLQGKPALTSLEARVQERTRDRASPMSPETTHETERERSVTKSTRRSAVTPSIQQPSPEALPILDRYLHRRRLRLVDIYNQTDKRKRKEISSKDLKSVRKEADIPISDLQFDDLVISLSSKHPNHISYKELSSGRQSWRRENMGERWSGGSLSPGSVRCLRSGSNQKSGSGERSAPSPLSFSLRSVGDTRPGGGSDSDGSRSQFLQVPPVSMEEMRPLSYEDMEEIGKNYRERKRRAKSNTRLLDWLEQCRLVRTGNAAIDAHSLPSTLGEESAERVEHFRRQELQQYHKILKLCQAYRLPLTEDLLEQAILYPGDKLIRGPGEQLHLRQPGTGLQSKERFYKKSAAAMTEPRESGTANKSPDRLPRCVGPYPPNSYVSWVKTRVRGKKRAGTESLNCWTTFEHFQEMSRNLKRRYPHCFFTASDNAFWPGQLTEKLRLYLPTATGNKSQ